MDSGKEVLATLIMPAILIILPMAVVVFAQAIRDADETGQDVGPLAWVYTCQLWDWLRQGPRLAYLRIIYMVLILVILVASNE